MKIKNLYNHSNEKSEYTEEEILSFVPFVHHIHIDNERIKISLYEEIDKGYTKYLVFPNETMRDKYIKLFQMVVKLNQ